MLGNQAHEEVSGFDISLFNVRKRNKVVCENERLLEVFFSRINRYFVRLRRSSAGRMVKIKAGRYAEVPEATSEPF
ncbi:hypothetical protein [Marinilabilia sp.]